MRWSSSGVSWAVCGLVALCLATSGQKTTKPAADLVKRADAAFHAGVCGTPVRQPGGCTNQICGGCALAASRSPKVTRRWERCWLSWENPWRAPGSSKQRRRSSRATEQSRRILRWLMREREKVRKAIPHFQSAESLSRQTGHLAPDAAFYDAYGRALADVGKPDMAASQFVAEEALTGPRADIEDAIGTLDAQQSKWAEARQHFEHALALDQTYLRARVHLAIVLRSQKDLQGALDTLAPAVEVNPPNAQVLVEVGRTLAAAGRDEDALKQFDAVLKADPTVPGVQLEMAMALQRLGRQPEAVPWFQQAVQREPKNVMALTNLGLALTLTGKGKDAIEYFKRALAQNDKDPFIYKDLGVCHIQLSAFDEAIEDFKKALALDPADPQLHYDLGLAYKFKDRTDEAVAELSKAGEMDPKLQDPPYTLGILYMQLGQAR